MNDWDHEEGRPSVGLKIEFFVLSVAWGLAMFAAILTLVGHAQTDAHPGGLAADGCHNDRVNGDKHCHRVPSAGKSTALKNDGSVYYPNCTAARAAGAAPLYRGQPGYSSHLDRDNDGKACE